MHPPSAEISARMVVGSLPALMLGIRSNTVNVLSREGRIAEDFLRRSDRSFDGRADFDSDATHADHYFLLYREAYPASRNPRERASVRM